jgi:hypothetical protein
MLVKRLGVFWGIAFVLGGILGFVPGITRNGMFLGFFMVNTPHNLLHIATGVVFLVASWLGARAARAWFRVFSVFYVALGLIGFRSGDRPILDLISNSLIDSWGHVFLGLVLLLIGFATPKAVDSTPVASAP